MTRQRSRGLVLMCVIAVMATACSLTGGAKGTPEPEVIEGVSLLTGLSSPFHVTGQESASYRIPAGQDFTATVEPANLGNKELLAAFVCLLDFRQVPCVEKQGTVFRYRLKAGQEGAFPIRLSGLAEGQHDLVMFSFYDPDQHSSKEEFRQMSRFMFQAVRATLFVGSAKGAPTVTYAASSQPDDRAKQGQGLFVLSDQPVGPQEPSPWRQKDVAPGATVAYHVAFNNVDTKPAQVGVVAFLNFEQVPVTPGTPVIFARVGSKERVSIAASLAAPRKAGNHELVVLLVDNPYLDLLANAKKTPDERAGFGAECSERVLIRVR